MTGFHDDMTLAYFRSSWENVRLADDGGAIYGSLVAAPSGWTPPEVAWEFNSMINPGGAYLNCAETEGGDG
jgi:hypothetical protein